MVNERPTHRHVSSRTTGNKPVEGIDPGGTRPTAAKRRQSGERGVQQVEHTVTSGDRNMRPQNPKPEKPSPIL
jgi:hypothetical protein